MNNKTIKQIQRNLQNDLDKSFIDFAKLFQNYIAQIRKDKIKKLLD